MYIFSLYFLTISPSKPQILFRTENIIDKEDLDFEPSTEYILETFDNGIADGTLCLSEAPDSDDDFNCKCTILSLILVKTKN